MRSRERERVTAAVFSRRETHRRAKKASVSKGAPPRALFSDSMSLSFNYAKIFFVCVESEEREKEKGRGGSGNG